MASMNLMLHLAAAIAFVAFGYWLARQRADLNFLRRLIAAKKVTRVAVMSPVAFTAAFARATGTPFEGGNGGAKPVRIELAAWADLLSVSPLRLIRWTDKTLTIVVAAAELSTVALLTESLSQAIGGIPVKVEAAPQDGVRHAHQA